MDYVGKRVLVVGMKSSGISVATLLRRSGAEVVCYDDAIKELTGFTFVDDITDEVMKKTDLVVVSPSIPPQNKAITKAKRFGVPVKGEMEIGCSFLRCPMIMVTGTNGKTTVVTMIEKLLGYAGIKTKAMGNVGYPVSQVILDGTELDYAVIEVSSFQLEYASVKPFISVILNLAPDHMDRYDSYEEYVATKRKICMCQTGSDYLLYNKDDGAARKFVTYTNACPIPIGTSGKNSAVYIKDNFYWVDDKPICSVKTCKLRGEHNKFNMLVALNVGKIVGARSKHFLHLIKEYTLLPNRIEYITSLGGKRYYNDSKGTNIHACKYAIAGIEGTIGLIMGGSDKGEDFCELFETIDPKVKYVAVSGGNAEKIYNSAMKMGYTSICILPTMEDAVQFLSERKDVENVLLSPCSASFDRYKNYAERGEKFKEAVYAIKNTDTEE